MFEPFKFTGKCTCCGGASNDRKARWKRPSWETVVVQGDVEMADGKVVTYPEPTRIELHHSCAMQWRRNKTFKRRPAGRPRNPELDRQVRVLLRQNFPQSTIVRALKVSRQRVRAVFEKM